MWAQTRMSALLMRINVIERKFTTKQWTVLSVERHLFVRVVYSFIQIHCQLHNCRSPKTHLKMNAISLCSSTFNVNGFWRCHWEVDSFWLWMNVWIFSYRLYVTSCAKQWNMDPINLFTIWRWWKHHNLYPNMRFRRFLWRFVFDSIIWCLQNSSTTNWGLNTLQKIHKNNLNEKNACDT